MSFFFSFSFVFHLKIFELICLILDELIFRSRLDFSCRFELLMESFFFLHKDWCCFLVHIVFFSHEFPFQTSCRLSWHCVWPLNSRKPFRMDSWTKQWLYFSADPNNFYQCCCVRLKQAQNKYPNTGWFQASSQHIKLSCHHVHPNMLNFNLYRYRKLYICR